LATITLNKRFFFNFIGVLAMISSAQINTASQKLAVIMLNKGYYLYDPQAHKVVLVQAFNTVQDVIDYATEELQAEVSDGGHI
jgi:hypothetical protein